MHNGLVTGKLGRFTPGRRRPVPGHNAPRRAPGRLQPITLCYGTYNQVMDRVVDAMKNVKFEIVATNLSKDQEQKLREAFGQE